MIRKGIPGITKIRKENRNAWHVFLTGESIHPADEYQEFSWEYFADIVARYHERGADLIGVTGNGLCFTIDPQNA